jgi:nucleoside-diphosphate-sugar epimerase
MDCFLVTGGAGFIGSHIVKALVRRNKKVRVLDNFLTGKRENLVEVRKRIDIIEGDIRDFEACRKAVRGISCVLHQAALPSVQRSVMDPLTTNEINITGTLNLLFAAKEAGARRFVFASSSSVYGDNPILPKKEGFEGKPLSPYAVSKQAGEYYCQLYSGLYGMETISLRYFNVFGPRQDPNSHYSAAIPLFIKKILQRESPLVYGDGEQSRDFTYVDNIVEANILASEAAITPGETVNIACGKSISINSLLKLINQILESEVAATYVARRPGEILHSLADISKAREVLSYTPYVTQNDGLKRTIAWYRRHL